VNLTGRVMILALEITEFEAAAIHDEIEKVFSEDGLATPDEAKAKWPALFELYNLVNVPMPNRNPPVTTSLSR
jgi:hypothetical protein